MESQEIRNKIQLAINKMKMKPDYSGVTDTRLLEVIGITIGIDKLEEILNSDEITKQLTQSYSHTPPIFIYNFIFSLIKYFKPETKLDPWFTLSSPLFHLPTEKTTGVCHSITEFNIINSIFADKKINLFQGLPIPVAKKVNSTFDLIISFPPLGMRAPHNKGTIFPTYFASELIIDCKNVLNKNGAMIFLVSSSVILEDERKEMFENAGLFVDAIFSIPSGTFLPLSNISSNLIIVRKEKQEITFIAEISQDESVNQAIIENYISRKAGKAIQLGALIDFKDFTTLQALISQNEMQELGQKYGSLPVQLHEIQIGIKALKVDNLEEVNHLPNSFYLPKIGNSPVVSSISSMRIKPKNYYQIQLDESKALSVFVTKYLNAPIGKKLRESLMTGNTILQIPKARLSNCLLYLPDIDTQAELSELDGKIDQLTLRLEELQRYLWKQPIEYKTISKELKIINHVEKLEKWIDMLPFPISSILWRYYATKENSKKIEHLFHFFEGFSEFFSLLILSSLRQDENFYRQECYKWIGTDKRFKEWYLRATFGNWNTLASNLSKATRVYLADSDTKDFCKNIFGNPSEAFLNMLANESIITVLNDVCTLRNKWKGHSGISSESENRQRVVILEQHLNDLRKNIADGFEETRILSPTTSGYSEGIYTFLAKELVGVRTPFNESSITSLIPLDFKKLYLYHSGQTKPIELFPFIKYIEVSDAIYFYTSIETKDARWISYHFDKQAEIRQPADNELFKAFDSLKL